MTDKSDSVLRAMTDDSSFRVIAATTTETVRAIVEAQGATGKSIEQISNLVTGTILIRETMSPQYRVQGILRSPEQGARMVADCYPDGTNRGLVSLPEGSTEIAIGHGTTLQIMRTLLNGQIHQGVVSLDDTKTMSDALMKYMQVSEQVTSVIDVATVMNGDKVVASGGYLVQLLPEVAEAMLAIMTERLHLFDPVDKLLREGNLTPKALADELLYGMPNNEMGRSSLEFGCQCSQVRIVAGLATLERSQIEELHQAGETLEISCDFCGKQYSVSPEQLRGLLQTN